MISYPNAKINLGLNILRKREDGFHDIESVFYPVPWNDILEVVPQKTGKGSVSFSSSGIEIPSNGGANLCEQVYNLMHEKYDLPSVKIHLHKQVPIGAGLGGGSADGAFTAVMLNDLFDLGMSDDEMQALVSRVGSDCPFFVRNQPAYVTGRGELLEPLNLDLSGCWIVLVNPGIHIGTAEAYAGIKPSNSKTSLKELLGSEVAEWNNIVKNDFEDSIFPFHSSIKQIKESLYESGADYASMTGSGSTVFGLFESKPEKLNIQADYSIKIAQL